MPSSPRAVELDLPFSEALPERIRPMLPMPASDPFDSSHHCFEVAWDGVRALATINRHGVQVWGRALRDLTTQYPEVQPLKELLPVDSLVDGELIVTDVEGRPDSVALQEREHAVNEPAVVRALQAQPITYVVYDLLYVRGRSLLTEPLHRRQSRLHQLLASRGRIYVPDAVVGEGIAFFEAAREKGLEGIVAKRLDSGYHPGRRHPDWLLVRAVRRDDFVVLGFIPGANRRLLEALVVGSYDGVGFRPVGRVVGGFDAGAALRLRRALDNLPAAAPPAGERWSDPDVAWIRPEIVVSVKFSEWDRHGLLRFPIFVAIRPEVTAEECARIPVIVPPTAARPGRLQIHLPGLPL